MNTCVKCGIQMNDESVYCTACSRKVKEYCEQGGPVMGRKKTGITSAMIATVAVVVVFAAWALHDVAAAKDADRQHFAPRHDQTARTAQAVAVKDEGGVVRIPVASVEDGKAHFFLLSSGGKNISFFAMRAPDGSIRTAFDACLACNHAKLGYRQESDSVVCNNCGMGFRPADIGRITGGCNPIPVKASVDGRTLVLKTKDLEAGGKYF